MPDILPVDEFRARPAGKVPLARDQVKGGTPPDADIAWEYGTSFCPYGRLAAVIVRGAGGRSDAVPLAVLLWSATLWAVTVTVCDVGRVEGAVYRPAEESVPTDGVIDQVTAVLLVPKTVGVNC